MNSDSILMISDESGNTIPFDNESILIALIDSCKKSNPKDDWIGEDIMNAIESTMHYQAEEGIFFTYQDVVALVIKTLERSGYYQISENFKKEIAGKSEFVEVNEESLKEVIQNKLELNNDDLLKVIDRVLSVTNILKIKEANPSLLFELAKHYRNKQIENIVLKQPIASNEKNPQLILTKHEVKELISREAAYFIDNKMISVASVSSLFPALKLKISLKKIAQHYNLKPIITEMLFFQYCFEVMTSIEELIRLTSKELFNNKVINDIEKFPVFLKFSDINSFCHDYLGMNCEEAKDIKCYKGIIEFFTDCIPHNFKVKVGKK